MHNAALQSCFLSFYGGERSAVSPFWKETWDLIMEGKRLFRSNDTKNKPSNVAVRDYNPLLLFICDFYAILPNAQANKQHKSTLWLPVCVPDSRVLKVKIYIFQFTHLLFYGFKQIIPTSAFKFMTIKRSVVRRSNKTEHRAANSGLNCLQVNQYILQISGSVLLSDGKKRSENGAFTTNTRLLVGRFKAFHR